MGMPIQASDEDRFFAELRTSSPAVLIRGKGLKVILSPVNEVVHE